ncbi:hypothetical protein THRCLA_20197 [Thraustotheca clavata]|uniref:Carbohydrate-binding protein n=1 Tax=Thraustotheca clavata TaxID=74557 RepID=A0A1W0AA84_9STRA|nr:hypothetical protein THRCLA_20197 [Thraustotheca clavata]
MEAMALIVSLGLNNSVLADLCTETVVCRQPGNYSCYLASGLCLPCLTILANDGIVSCVGFTTSGVCPLGYVECNASTSIVTTSPDPTTVWPSLSTTTPTISAPTTSQPTSKPRTSTVAPTRTSSTSTPVTTALKTLSPTSTSTPTTSTTAESALPSSTTSPFYNTAASSNNTASHTQDTAPSSSGNSNWIAAVVVGGIAFVLLVLFVARRIHKSRQADKDDDCAPEAPMTFTGQSDFQSMKRLRTVGSEDDPVPIMPPVQPPAFNKCNTEFVSRSSLRNSAADTPPRVSTASSMDFEIHAMISPAYSSSRGNSSVDLWDEMPILRSQKQMRLQNYDQNTNSFTL